MGAPFSIKKMLMCLFTRIGERFFSQIQFEIAGLFAMRFNCLSVCSLDLNAIDSPHSSSGYVIAF